MNIGLDYDGTYTTDPQLWKVFVRAALMRGHRVFCTTARRPEQHPGLAPGEPPLPPGVPCIFAPRGYKREAAEQAGVHIDVWIDDMPGMIEAGRVLSW